MSFIEVFRDVTERKRLEEEIIQAKVKIETLAQSERLKTDLLSMVSHELRTPLSVIKSHITTFLRHNNKWEDGEKLDFLRDIDQETDDLARLVGNLLDMSSLEAGAMKLQKDYYQISEILEWAGKKLKTLTQDHVMSVRIKPELQDVFVDRTRIGQVIINLCENAAKYSHRGSRILIEAACLDNTVVVSVVDEGEGIASQYLDKVFDRFYRVGKNNHSESGIGLGLAICRGIIEAHGGKIWAESTEGKGSKFSFSLPVKGKESEPDDTQPVIR
jgi:two-component system sensor histidine kinase KdpD